MTRANLLGYILCILSVPVKVVGENDSYMSPLQLLTMFGHTTFTLQCAIDKTITPKSSIKEMKTQFNISQGNTSLSYNHSLNKCGMVFE